MSTENVDTYAVIDQWDDIYAPSSDNRVGCKQCSSNRVCRTSTVVVECVDCLSTPARNDCICPRNYGLDNCDGVATQDWQTASFRDALLRYEETVPFVEDDIWLQSTATRNWNLWLRARYSALDVAEYLKKRLDLHVWKKIAGYWSEMYYHRNSAKLFKDELSNRHFKEVMEWRRLQAVNHLAYEAPMRGYCMRCGEPAINNRTHTPLATRLIKAHPDLWGARYLGRYRTIKYGLGVMGVCHRCLVNGYNYLIHCRRVVVPYHMKGTEESVRGPCTCSKNCAHN